MTNIFVIRWEFSESEYNWSYYNNFVTTKIFALEFAKVCGTWRMFNVHYVPWSENVIYVS